MSEMGMVERVARHLSKAAGVDPDGQFGADPNWTRFEMTARLAIEAMREPTRGMLAEGRYAVGDLEADVSKEVWQAMLDAALTTSRTE